MRAEKPNIVRNYSSEYCYKDVLVKFIEDNNSLFKFGFLLENSLVVNASEKIMNPTICNKIQKVFFYEKNILLKRSGNQVEITNITFKNDEKNEYVFDGMFFEHHSYLVNGSDLAHDLFEILNSVKIDQSINLNDDLEVNLEHNDFTVSSFLGGKNFLFSYFKENFVLILFSIVFLNIIVILIMKIEIFENLTNVFRRNY